MKEVKISKEEFVEIINHLKDEDEKWRVFNVIMDELSPDFINTFYPQSENHTYIIELLVKLFDLEKFDEYGTDIDYFIYELNYGEKAEELWFEDKGKKWMLKTPEDLYDYLVYEENK